MLRAVRAMRGDDAQAGGAGGGTSISIIIIDHGRAHALSLSDVCIRCRFVREARSVGTLRGTVW